MKTRAFPLLKRVPQVSIAVDTYFPRAAPDRMSAQPAGGLSNGCNQSTHNDMQGGERLVLEALAPWR